MSVHKNAAAKTPRGTRRKPMPVTVTRLDPIAEAEVKRIAATIPGSVVRIISGNTAVIWNGDYKHPKVK
jgi:hypothetical protein